MTTRARCSMFTWCTMPVPGGTTRKPSKACCPQRRNWKRSRLRWNSSSTLRAKASGRPKTSATTEWSMTSSAGISGLIFVGSPPSSCMASRIAARSTTAGTPVRSWRITRAGVNWISVAGASLASQFASALMWSLVMLTPSSLRSRFSSRIFRLYGSRSLPGPASIVARLPKLFAVFAVIAAEPPLIPVDPWPPFADPACQALFLTNLQYLDIKLLPEVGGYRKVMPRFPVAMVRERVLPPASRGRLGGRSVLTGRPGPRGRPRTTSPGGIWHAVRHQDTARAPGLGRDPRRVGRGRRDPAVRVGMELGPLLPADRRHGRPELRGLDHARRDGHRDAADPDRLPGHRHDLPAPGGAGP